MISLIAVPFIVLFLYISIGSYKKYVNEKKHEENIKLRAKVYGAIAVWKHRYRNRYTKQFMTDCYNLHKNTRWPLAVSRSSFGCRMHVFWVMQAINKKPIYNRKTSWN